MKSPVSGISDLKSPRKKSRVTKFEVFRCSEAVNGDAVGPNTKGGHIVVNVKAGLSFFTKSHAAFSAKVFDAL